MEESGGKDLDRDVCLVEFCACVGLFVSVYLYILYYTSLISCVRRSIVTLVITVNVGTV